MRNLLISTLLIMFFSCNQELPKQYWQKGNLHTHSFWSDGDDFPEMILKWYKDNNYQFTALSDHNTIASGDYWYKLKKSDINLSLSLILLDKLLKASILVISGIKLKIYFSKYFIL